MTASNGRVGIGAHRLSELIYQAEAWAESYEIARWPKGARAEPTGRLIDLLAGRISDPSTGKRFGDLFPVSQEESPTALALRLRRFLYGAPPSHTPSPRPPDAVTDPPIDARGLGMLWMNPKNADLWAAQPIALRRVWACLSVLAGCYPLSPKDTGVSSRVQEYVVRHPGKLPADSPPAIQFIGMDHYLEWKTYGESSGMDAEERREWLGKWQSYAAALGAPGWDELSEMSGTERSRYEAAMAPHRKRVIALTARFDWSRPGGYTLSDLAAFAGVRTHRQRQRLRDSLLELGIIRRTETRLGVRRGAAAQPTYAYVDTYKPSRADLKLFNARMEKLKVLTARRETVRIRDAAKRAVAALRHATPHSHEIEQTLHAAAPGLVLNPADDKALPKDLTDFLREGSALLSDVLNEAWLKCNPDFPDYWERALAGIERLPDKRTRDLLRRMAERARANRAEHTPEERQTSRLKKLREIAETTQASGAAAHQPGVLGKLGPEREGWSLYPETPWEGSPVRYLVLPIYLVTTPDEGIRRGRAAQAEAFGRPLG